MEPDKKNKLKIIVEELIKNGLTLDKENFEDYDASEINARLSCQLSPEIRRMTRHFLGYK